MTEINVWPEQNIAWWPSKFLHKLRIDKKSKKMFKNNIEVKYKYREEGLKIFDEFIRGSHALICHSAMDFETLEANIEKGGAKLENFEVINKVDSQRFFQFAM